MEELFAGVVLVWLVMVLYMIIILLIPIYVIMIYCRMGRIARALERKPDKKANKEIQALQATVADQKYALENQVALLRTIEKHLSASSEHLAYQSKVAELTAGQTQG